MFFAKAAPISPQGDNWRGAEVLLRNRLDLRLGQREKIRRLSRDDSLECLWMMAFQVFAQKLHRAALSRCMANQDDCFGVDKVSGYLFVVGILLGNMVALVMGFLPMDQMMLETERIVRLDSELIFRPAAAEIVVNMGDVMVNDHDHSSDLVCFCGFPKNASFF